MSASLNKNRILYFDWLRLFGAFAVVLIHVSVNRMLAEETGSGAWWVCNCCDAVSRWAVPIFVMISGTLFLDPLRQIDYRILFRKNLLRLVVAFVFWSGLYAVVDYCEGVRLRDVVSGFLIGHTHLWFLYMLAGLYLIVPLLRKLMGSRRLIKYYLLLWFVLCILFSTFRYVATVFDDGLGEWLKIIAEKTNLDVVAGYAGYFILGRVLTEKELSKKTRGWIYLAGIVGAAAACVMTWRLCQHKGRFDASFYNNDCLFVLLESVAVFTLLKYHSPACRKDSGRRVLQTVSVCTFGIYLIHMLPVHFTEKLFPAFAGAGSPFVSVPVITAAAFLSSLLLAFVLRKIPVVNKLIV